MLRIAVQSKGRLFDDTMNLLTEADIKVSSGRRTLLVQSSNFPLEVLYLRDDDIPQSVASGVADIGVVGENEFVERGEDAEIISRLGFSKCRLSLAIPKEIDYKEMPELWAVCQNRECERAGECLRFQACSAVPERFRSWRSVLPLIGS